MIKVGPRSRLRVTFDVDLCDTVPDWSEREPRDLKSDLDAVSVADLLKVSCSVVGTFHCGDVQPHVTSPGFYKVLSAEWLDNAATRKGK